ncbi:MAG: response regulator, partial [Candidatus Margulisbacteria bacterium]|nr:response regulator [Candidatus Margulisiibacteriota bacterium]
MGEENINKQVLIVEDNAICRGNIRRAIQKTYRVIDVETKHQCFQYLEKDKIDLILLDITLPDNTGLHIIRDILKQYPWIPIIVITEDEDPDNAAEMIKLGAKDYIRKSKFFKNIDILNYKMERVFETERYKSICEAREHEINHLNRKSYLPTTEEYKNTYLYAEVALKGQLSLLI